MTPLLSIGVFRELRDPAAFKSVRVAMGAIGWSGGQDLGPDTLYLDSVPVRTLLTAREKSPTYRASAKKKSVRRKRE